MSIVTLKVTRSQNNHPRSNTRSSFGFPVLSFFTGAGFLDIGFMQAGFDIIWRNDNNLVFVDGFQAAMASMEATKGHDYVVNTNSIVDLEPNKIGEEAFNSLPRPEHFAIIGGPPCPDFSVGGKNRGANGDNGRLSQVFVDRIMSLQPTFFLFENVIGLFRTKKHRKFFDKLRLQLHADYVTDTRILNALEYGVPQDRERVIMIGFHKRWIERNLPVKIMDMNEGWFPWPVDPRYKDAKSKFSWPTTSPFGSTPEKPENIPDELMVGPWICNVDEIFRLPNGDEFFQPRSDKFRWIPEGDDSRKSFKRLHRWRYSPTVAYGNNEVHLHPTQARRLSVREALRLQTVPDDYVLPPKMPLSHKFKMIGNGVPVRLAYVIAESIRTVLTGGDWS